jgi:hypothetical protein
MFTWPSGVYTPGVSTITADAMNYLRATIAGQALDIIDGGTYTPVAKTTLTGTIGLRTNFSATGLEVAGLGGLHVINGSSAYIDSGAALVMSAGSTATLASTAFFYIANSAEQIVQNGGQFTVANGGISLVQSGGSLTAQSGSAVNLQGTNTISGATTFSGASGKVYWRRGTRLSPGATTTIDVTKDYWKFTNPAGVPTVVTVTAPTGEPAGLVVRAFTVDALTNTITFKDAGTTMVTFVTGTAAKQYVEFLWDGSAWEVANVSANATLAAGY